MSVCANGVPDFCCRLSRTVFLAWTPHMLSTSVRLRRTDFTTSIERSRFFNKSMYQCENSNVIFKTEIG